MQLSSPHLFDLNLRHHKSLFHIYDWETGLVQVNMSILLGALFHSLVWHALPIVMQTSIALMTNSSWCYLHLLADTEILEIIAPTVYTDSQMTTETQSSVIDNAIVLLKAIVGEWFVLAHSKRLNVTDGLFKCHARLKPQQGRQDSEGEESHTALKFFYLVVGTLLQTSDMLKFLTHSIVKVVFLLSGLTGKFNSDYPTKHVVRGSRLRKVFMFTFISYFRMCTLRQLHNSPMPY